MFFRFGAALMLVVSVALAGTALETQNLSLKRSISRQQYRLEVLLESQTSLRLESQRLGAPAKLLDAMDRGDAALSRPAKPQRADVRRSPLLNWNGPSAPASALRDSSKTSSAQGHGTNHNPSETRSLR